MNASEYQDTLEQSSWQYCIKLLQEIPTLPFDEQIKAIEYLLINPSPWIRQRAITVAAIILPEIQLLKYLRNGKDDVLRNAALEILRKKGSSILSFAINLLQDKDEDVVLQAVLLLDYLKDTRALEPIRQLLHHDNLNIVQAAIIAMGHIGDKRIVPDIIPFLQKDPWLQIAAIQALSDVKDSSTIKYLEKLLCSPFIDTLAAEAIAKIGGKKALKTLANYFINNEKSLDVELMLNLLAHTMEGIINLKPFENKNLLYKRIAAYLNSGNDVAKIAASRCIIALGPGKYDNMALRILTATNVNELPYSCLYHRKDLIAKLLNYNKKTKVWGLILLSKFYPSINNKSIIINAINKMKLNDIESDIIKLLEKMPPKIIAPKIIDLYIKLPLYKKHLLIPILQKNKNVFKKLLSKRKDIPYFSQFALELILSPNKQELINEIDNFSYLKIAKIIKQLIKNNEVLEKLSWKKWLSRRPKLFIPLAAEAALNKTRKVLSILRKILIKHPEHNIIKMVGSLKDEKSIPALIKHLENVDPITKALIAESLGILGGQEARKALIYLLENTNGSENAIIYQALAKCATNDDLKLFQKAASNPNWVIRLSSIEVLAKYLNKENITILTRLAADSNDTVSKKASIILDKLHSINKI